MVKLSNSRLNTYEECAYKYKLKYVDKLETETIYSSLHLGSALDTTLNILLLATKDSISITLDELNETFKQAFTYYLFRGDENPIDVRGYENYDHYKKEYKPESLTADQVYDVFERYAAAPETLTWETNKSGYQYVCWLSNYNIGLAVILTYYTEILPAILRDYDITAVQKELLVVDEDGNEFVAIEDFTARKKDTGKNMVMDNKSTSNLKKDYKQGAVEKSKQLATYSEFEGWEDAGFVAYEKKVLPSGLVPWSIVTGTISEEFRASVFDNIANVLDKVKRQEYDKNEKGCFSYGRKCSYWGLCKYNSTKGIYRKE